jgi:hypothetical protein
VGPAGGCAVRARARQHVYRQRGHAAGAGARPRSQRDGYLSPDELASDVALRYNWIAVDRNRDGRISRSEFEALGTR